MSYRQTVGMSLLLGLMAAWATHAQGAGDPAAGQSAVADLGTGTLSVQTHQDASGLILVLATDLPRVVALSVQAPGEADDLVRVTAKSGDKALGTRAKRATKASLNSSANTVTGPYQIAIVHDLSQSPGLILTVYDEQGKSFPFTISGLAGSATVKFTLRGTNCIESTTTCGPPNPCTVTTTYLLRCRSGQRLS